MLKIIALILLTHIGQNPKNTLIIGDRLHVLRILLTIYYFIINSPLFI